MKKIISLILFSIITNCSYSQKDTISTDIEFKNFVYQCIDSLLKKDSIRYSPNGYIRMELNLYGELKKYDIIAGNKKQKLRKRDYKWLFNLLNQKNYKTLVIDRYTPDELKTTKLFLIGIRYSF
jgi:hypothetical protein